MKTALVRLLCITFLLSGCKKNEINVDGNLTDGFCIVSGDKVILNSGDIDFYDYSAHLIYLKPHKSFAADIQGIGGFTVYANGKEIYAGQTLPGYSSSMSSGPVIRTHPSFYGDYIVPVDFFPKTDSLGNPIPDPREDERIVEALKAHNQFHAGLSCELKSVNYVSSDDVKVTLQLKNNDSFSYWYLDPQKMGTGLFHWFTNGLYLYGSDNAVVYTHTMEPVAADPWNGWKKEWLSVIRGNESKTLTIVYRGFDKVPKGRYRTAFEYPGLSSQVSRNDLYPDNVQVWLGKLEMSSEATVE